MKPDPIKHPSKNYRPLRPAYVTICGGHACAALILSLMEHWHYWKQQANGQKYREHVFLTQEQICEELYGAYGIAAIRTACTKLHNLGYVIRSFNPDPRKKWDRTYHYRFDPKAVQWALDRLGKQSAESHKGICETAGSKMGNRRSNTTNHYTDHHHDPAVTEKGSSNSRSSRDVAGPC